MGLHLNLHYISVTFLLIYSHHRNEGGVSEEKWRKLVLGVISCLQKCLVANGFQPLPCGLIMSMLFHIPATALQDEAIKHV